MRSATLLALLLTAPGLDAVAQQSALQSGQRVRVTAPTVWRERRVLLYEGLAEDTLLLRVPSGSQTLFGAADGTVLRLPEPLVTRLEVSSGGPAPGTYALGAVLVAAIMGGAYLAYDALTSDVEPCTWQEGIFCDRVMAEETGNLIKGLLVFVPAAAVSAGVFRLITAERWSTAPGERRVTAGVVPVAGGRYALRVTLRP